MVVDKLSLIPPLRADADEIWLRSPVKVQASIIMFVNEQGFSIRLEVELSTHAFG